MKFGELSYHAPPPDGLTWTRPLWRLHAKSDVMLRLKRIFPRAETYRAGYITLDHTPEIARDLEWMLERWPLVISAEDLGRLSAAADDHRRREEVVNEILTGDRPHLDLREPARPARDYQLVAADLALVSGSLLLTDDLGLGKSMSGLLVLRDPARLPALIVCPTHLPSQWVSELDWSPGMHDQCIGRLHRDGQDESVVAYFLVSEIGSDPVIAEVLNIKRMQSEPLRDPDAELVEEAQDTRGRVRKLAEEVMAQRNAKAAA